MIDGNMNAYSGTSGDPSQPCSAFRSFSTPNEAFKLFKPGDLVLLSSTFDNRRVPKLSRPFVGPYAIPSSAKPATRCAFQSRWTATHCWTAAAWTGDAAANPSRARPSARNVWQTANRLPQTTSQNTTPETPTRPAHQGPHSRHRFTQTMDFNLVLISYKSR